MATQRHKAVLDKSAWLLVIPAAAALHFFDPALAATLFQWSVFALILVGVSIMLSRFVFPQVDLTALVKKAEEGNAAAGFIAGALIIFFGILFFSLIYWAKS